MTKESATANNITPQMVQINDILTSGLSQTTLLAGAPLNVILLDVDDVTVLTVSEVATLVSNLVQVRTI